MPEIDIKRLPELNESIYERQNASNIEIYYVKNSNFVNFGEYLLYAAGLKVI